MADQATEPDFRFKKIMTWGPAILLVFALLLVFMGETVAGILVAVAAILFWVIVRRRRQAPPPTDSPSSPGEERSGTSAS